MLCYGGVCCELRCAAEVHRMVVAEANNRELERFPSALCLSSLLLSNPPCCLDCVVWCLDQQFSSVGA